MGKIHKDLKRAEKEYTARKRQQLPEQPSQSQKKAYLLILAVFSTSIFGLYYFRAIIADYPTNSRELSGKFHRNVVTGKVPVSDPSRIANLGLVSGMQQPEIQKDVRQQVEASSRPESEPIAGPQISINSVQKKDQKKEAIDSLAETNFTQVPPNGADHSVIAIKPGQNEPAYHSKNTQEPSELEAATHPDTKNEFFREPSMAPVLRAKPNVTDKEEPPDPGKLIDWLLKKRAMQNE